MDEEQALRAIERKDEAALAWVIDRYSAYVNTIIYNISGKTMTAADIEEVTSDVFLVLWSSAAKVRPDKLKAYLGGIARNKAKEKNRSKGLDIPLEEDLMPVSDIDIELEFEGREQAEFIRRALLTMEHPDREIFLRHYYYYQTTAQIAKEMNVNCSTVKTRLRRGRDRLKESLYEGGYEIDK
ncbi:MAG: sigma-70 family RNA polymerase sigma factor [Bacillota bacterium]|nr:sigma-70 family RNA polymerase sigma factor [Bacillota bacterium]